MTASPAIQSWARNRDATVSGQAHNGCRRFESCRAHHLGMYITNSGPEAAGQPDHGIVADRREGFKAHVSGGWRSTRRFAQA